MIDSGLLFWITLYCASFRSTRSCKLILKIRQTDESLVAEQSQSPTSKKA